MSQKSEKHMLIYLSTRSCDAMYHVRESKSKLVIFNRLYIKLYYQSFFAQCLKWCYDENRIFPMAAILKYEQVACVRRKVFGGFRETGPWAG